MILDFDKLKAFPGEVKKEQARAHLWQPEQRSVSIETLIPVFDISSSLPMLACLQLTPLLNLIFDSFKK
jgi:hypothetical protein